MNILNICMGAPFTENYSYQDNLLSEYQCKLGHNVTVLTTTRTRDNNGKITSVKPGEKNLSNGVQLIRIQEPPKAIQFLGIYNGVGKIIEEISPDLIFIHGLSSMVPQSAIAYKRKHSLVHIVADNHADNGTTYTEKFPFNLQLYIYRFLWKGWIRYVDRIYGTTSWRKTFAKKYYGIPEEKLDVLIMGVDSDRMPDDPDLVRIEIRKELGLTDEDFVFITGGKLDSRKKIIETVKAFNSIENCSIRLIVFGSIQEDVKDEFNKLLHIDDRIHYIGYIDSRNVHRYFFASDFGLFPGRHSVLWEEAIGCGLPCLFHMYEDEDHTDVCGNCIRINNADENEIRTIMKKVVEQPNYYNELRIKSQIASSTFSYISIAKKSIECMSGKEDKCRN